MDLVKLIEEGELDNETREEAIELLKDAIDTLSVDDDEKEEVESVKVDEECCKEAASIIADAMSAVMESDVDYSVKLEATAILNESLYNIIEAEMECCDGLPEEVAENESEEEICSKLGERNPTEVDVEADYGEEEVKESAADLILSILNK